MSSSFGGSSSSGGGTTTVVNPQAQAAARDFAKYLDGLDTSTVDNTYKNIANTAYGLSSQLPDYVYNVDGSDAARQRMENAVYNQAAGRLNEQFAADTADLNTRLQNQGLSVGSRAYQNAMNSLQDAQYDALNNAAYESVIQGQNAFSNSLQDSVTAGNFTNNARQLSLSEILQILQNSVSGYQAEKEKFDALSQTSDQVSKEQTYSRKNDGMSLSDAASLAATAAQLFAASDLRLKENIVPVGRLDNGLTVYRFNYIGSPTTQIGLIAQEVRDVCPEAVAEGEDGYLRVNYALAAQKQL